MNPSELIDKQIEKADGWKGEMLAKLRRLIHKADPDITEEWKWGTAIFSHNGMVCGINSFKDHVKLKFFKGAYVPDPDEIINSGFDAQQHRSIDFKEGEAIPEEALLAFISSAVKYNLEK